VWKRGRPPTPPQLQAATPFGWRDFACASPATIFSPAGCGSTFPFVRLT
jgi:hypothetical protein